MHQPAHRTAAPSAYDEIRTAIIEGRYEPDARLVETRLAAELDTSRTPIREALRKLEAEGLVVFEPNRGAKVRSLSVEDVQDLYGLRARLEGYAAELAAQRRDEADLAAIGKGLDAYADALAGRGDDAVERARALDAANHLVHAAILAAARHKQLAHLLSRTVDDSLVFRAFRVFSRDQAEQSDLFHRLIARAIEAGEPERAGALMTEHILAGRDVLLEALRS